MTIIPPCTAEALERLRMLVNSFERLTGKQLVDVGHSDLWQACWSAHRVIVAHGTEQDPVFFYGNELALGLFEMDFATFTRLPSRYSAEPLLREERDSLLARVRDRGFIDDYTGVRVSASGRRFRIARAVVWDFSDSTGKRFGQAATFERWEPLEPRSSNSV